MGGFGAPVAIVWLATRIRRPHPHTTTPCTTGVRSEPRPSGITPAPRASNGTTPLWDHVAHNEQTAHRAFVPHLHNGQSAQRAVVPRAAQRANARRSRHNGRSTSATDSPHRKKGIATTLPGRRTVWHSVAARALEQAVKIPTISCAQRSPAMPCSVLRSSTLGVPAAWADHTHSVPHRHNGPQSEPRPAGITPGTTGLKRYYARLGSRFPTTGAQQNGLPYHTRHHGRSAERAVVPHPAPRALARGSWHNGRWRIETAAFPSKTDCHPRAPDAERWSSAAASARQQHGQKANDRARAAVGWNDGFGAPVARRRVASRMRHPHPHGSTPARRAFGRDHAPLESRPA